MTRDDAERWLTAYVEAWRSYDDAAIADLFTDDAEYRYHPWDEPVVGPAAIAASWQDPTIRDEPDAWTAQYSPWAIEGDRVVVTGATHYDDAEGKRTYHTVFVCEFAADGRCRRFTEVYMLQK